MLPVFTTSQPFTRRRYPTITDHGTEVVDLTGTPSTADYGGSIQPGTGTTDPMNRDGAEVVYTIFTSPDVDVRHRDLIEYAGQDYFVNGEPERWATGILDHTVIRLSRWDG